MSIKKLTKEEYDSRMTWLSTTAGQEMQSIAVLMGIAILEHVSGKQAIKRDLDGSRLAEHLEEMSRVAEQCAKFVRNTYDDPEIQKDLANVGDAG